MTIRHVQRAYRLFGSNPTFEKHPSDFERSMERTMTVIDDAVERYEMVQNNKASIRLGNYMLAGIGIVGALALIIIEVLG